MMDKEMNMLPQGQHEIQNLNDATTFLSSLNLRDENNPFEKLCNEMLFQIIIRLPIMDRMSFSQSCKRMYTLFNSSKKFHMDKTMKITNLNYRKFVQQFSSKENIIIDHVLVSNVWFEELFDTINRDDALWSEFGKEVLSLRFDTCEFEMVHDAIRYFPNINELILNQNNLIVNKCSELTYNNLNRLETGIISDYALNHFLINAKNLNTIVTKSYPIMPEGFLEGRKILLNERLEIESNLNKEEISLDDTLDKLDLTEEYLKFVLSIKKGQLKFIVKDQFCKSTLIRDFYSTYLPIDDCTVEKKDKLEVDALYFSGLYSDARYPFLWWSMRGCNNLRTLDITNYTMCDFDYLLSHEPFMLTDLTLRDCSHVHINNILTALCRHHKTLRRLNLESCRECSYNDIEAPLDCRGDTFFGFFGTTGVKSLPNLEYLRFIPDQTRYRINPSFLKEIKSNVLKEVEIDFTYITGTTSVHDFLTKLAINCPAVMKLTIRTRNNYYSTNENVASLYNFKRLRQTHYYPVFKGIKFKPSTKYYILQLNCLLSSILIYDKPSTWHLLKLTEEIEIFNKKNSN